MAVYNNTCRGYKIKINNVEHFPPHCHVNIDGRNKQIGLMNCEILNPPPNEVPPPLRRCLQENLAEMFEAWDNVRIMP